MTKLRENNTGGVLDQDVLALLGAATLPADLPRDRMQQLRTKVIAKLDADTGLTSPYLTIRANDGTWIELEPLLEKKVLDVDDNGIESYLLRMQPGATTGRHQHDSDELCIVLEGDVSFDDVHLTVGDCHIARKGSWHGTASTVHGARRMMAITNFGF